MNATFPEIISSKLTALGVKPGDRFLIALSGGGDSTALALSMCEAYEKKDLAAAHLDHGVREGSRDDRSRVEDLCRDLGMRIVSGRLDPHDLADEVKRRGSLEGAMRTLRYRFLRKAADEASADWILTGHTVDDQAETVLFRVRRGMDWRSLAGIPEKRDPFLRPLLGVTGSQAREYCREMGIVPLEDPTNLQNVFTRNRMRNVTIPFLAGNFHPAISLLLPRVAKAANLLGDAEKRLLGKLHTVEGGGSMAVIDLAGFFEIPEPLQRGAVILFLDSVLQERPSGSLVTDTVRLLHSKGTGQIDLPDGSVLEVAYGKATIRPARSLDGVLRGKAVPLTVPGVVHFADAGFSISAEEGRYEERLDRLRGNTVILSAGRVGSRLWVRGRQPGDRFMPLGMDREKKLKDFFIDRKVPRPDRGTIPVIVDGEGRILWVAGIEISQLGAVAKVPGEKIVILRMEREKTVENRGS